MPTPSSSTTSLIAPPSPPFTASEDLSLPSASSSHFQLPPTPPSDIQSNNGIEQGLATISISPNQTLEVDPQILEALKNKDRIYVLKLGELMEGLINDRSGARIDLTPATSYQRLLVHRCSAYYKLSPESDPVTKSISVGTTLESRIPARRLCELVPAESSAQPAFQIMRRSLQDRRSNRSQSQAGSVTGEDVDFSDVEPSEAGSLGGRSNATGGSNKKRMTIEEREAAYNEARSRIFMGFEEKEKEKGKELSASSSSASLASGGSASASTSAAGGSSAGDMDDATSSPTTESEWSGPSGPTSRDKKDVQRMSLSTSSRSLRSSAPSFNANGQGSSRNSRAPSPSFTYANIYEPPLGPAFDLSQHPPQPGYHHPSQYHYPYMHSGQPPNPYIPPYQYYPPYNPYQQAPPPQPHGLSDPTSPSNGEIYSAPPHSGYGPPYGWPPYPHPPPIHSPPHMQQPLPQLPPQQPHPNTNHAPPPPAHGPPYQQYMPPSQAYQYPMPGYYPPQHGQHVEPPTPHMAVQPMYDVPRSMNGTIMPPPHHNNSAPATGRNDISNPSNNVRSPPRNPSSGGGGKARGVPPIPPTRSSWSYGPGVGMNGHAPSVGGDAFGPRLNSTRRQSGNSSTNSRSSNNDDVSSTASSSTSSSSQRTYTSTSTSSQHPLPPRPDWAVGLKPQPTLHPTQGRHHDHSLGNSRTMSPISPPRSLNGAPSQSNASNASRQSQSQQMPPVTLQSADFPPLISLAPAPEKRTPVAGGAWGNSPRSIHLPGPGQLTSPPNSLVHHPNHSTGSSSGSETRLDESDHTFERPPPKSSELYNPKLLRRPTGGKVNGEKEKERARGEAVAGAILVSQVSSMSVEDESTESMAPPNEVASVVMAM